MTHSEFKLLIGQCWCSPGLLAVRADSFSLSLVNANRPDLSLVNSDCPGLPAVSADSPGLSLVSFEKYYGPVPPVFLNLQYEPRTYLEGLSHGRWCDELV